VTARTPEGPGIRWRRALFWAFPLVVFAFLTATIISQLVASAIDEAADRVVTDYSPSVIALATARSELHRIQDFVSDYVDGDDPRVDRERVAAALAELDRAVAAYLRLPFQPGERELWERVASDIFAFRGIVDRTLAAVDREDAAGARKLVRGELRAVVDRTSADILSDIEFNANAADADGRLIARRHRSSLRAAILLAIASVTFTAAVALFVHRLMAEHDSLQRRHAAMLEEANAELEAFASRLSHDILSPLTSTKLAIDAALRAANDETVRRSLQRGAGALDRVSRIARALFEFARAGARPGPDERGDVGAVVNEILEEYRPLAAETGVSLEASLPAPLWVACNDGLLTAALSNLVRNAITHMDGAPGKRVDVVVVDDGHRARIEVRDTGPGLAPGTEATMFEPFVRGPGATHAGLGLGLATVKRIAETHGGTVGVDSRAGAGCRFWIDLPKVAPPP
jgi:signal transduction histidine kinase